MSSKKPNVLVIVTDQQRPDLFGAAGRLPIKTPVLDRLCEEGTMFERGYSPCPLCTPARATLVSGQYPSRHRAWSIGVDTPMDVLSLPQILRERGGYRTGIIGKSHLLSCHKEGSLEGMPHIRDLDYFRKWTGPWFGFEYAKISVGHVAEGHAYSMHYGAWLEDHGVPAEPPFFSETCDAHDVIGADRLWKLPEERQSCAWVAEETMVYLSDHAENHRDESFYLSVNFPEPHPPFMAPEPWNSMYDDVDLPPPNRREGEWEDKSTLYKATVQNRLNELCWHDKVPIACQFIEDSDGAVRNSTEIRKWKSYMGMQSMLDKYLGNILNQLAALGLSEDTLVIYTADHGDFMGDHYIWHKGGSHYDASVRVPFIVRWPGKVPADVKSAALQSLVDIPSTVLAAAKLSIPGGMQGINQMETWLDPAICSRNGVLIDHRVEKGLYVNSWITERYRLSVYSILAENRDEVELFDLKNDPEEQYNAAAENPDVVHALMLQLLRYRMEVSGPWPERSAFA